MGRFQRLKIMADGMLVVAEQRQGKLKKVSLEAIGAALALGRERGFEVAAAVMGHRIRDLADELAQVGVSKVFMADDPILEHFNAQAYARVLAGVVASANPKLILMGFTAFGRSLGPRLAARVDAGIATDCTDLLFREDGGIEVVRPVYSGKVIARVGFRGGGSNLITLRPNVFPAVEAGAGNSAEIVDVSVDVPQESLGAMVKEIVWTSAGRKDLTEAEIIVSGGRSLKSAENFRILEELADALGASVGASRAAVDAGYAPHSMQVGQTGKVVNPVLYIACGISGAIQHLAGMRTSKVVVAINKDPNAPIFGVADYGIVGDLFEVVPHLTQEFKKLLKDG